MREILALIDAQKLSKKFNNKIGHFWYRCQEMKYFFETF